MCRWTRDEQLPLSPENDESGHDHASRQLACSFEDTDHGDKKAPFSCHRWSLTNPNQLHGRNHSKSVKAPHLDGSPRVGPELSSKESAHR